MKFPVTVVKGTEEAQVLHTIDLKGWLDAGWEVKGAKKKAGRPPKDEKSKKKDEDKDSFLGL